MSMICMIVIIVYSIADKVVAGVLYSGYQYENKNREYDYTQDYRFDTNTCLVLESDSFPFNKCLVCNDTKYYLSRLTGRCKDKSDTCEKRGRDGCDICAFGYYVDKGGKCSNCIDGCAVCTNSDVCRLCYPDHVPWNNKCVKHERACSDDIVQGLIGNEIFSSILYSRCNIIGKNSYFSTRWVKKECSLGPCLSCENENKCALCMKGTYLNSYGNCQKCEDDKCYECNKPNECLKCKFPNTMNETNRTCYRNQTIKGEVIYPCPKNCLDCTDQGRKCQVCDLGFEPKNGSCVVDESNCLIFNTVMDNNNKEYNNCSMCSHQYELVFNSTDYKGSCSKLPDGCQKKRDFGKGCAFCHSGFQIDWNREQVKYCKPTDIIINPNPPTPTCTITKCPPEKECNYPPPTICPEEKRCPVHTPIECPKSPPIKSQSSQGTLISIMAIIIVILIIGIVIVIKKMEAMGNQIEVQKKTVNPPPAIDNNDTIMSSNNDTEEIELKG